MKLTSFFKKTLLNEIQISLKIYYNTLCLVTIQHAALFVTISVKHVSASLLTLGDKIM